MIRDRYLRTISIEIFLIVALLALLSIIGSSIFGLNGAVWVSAALLFVSLVAVVIIGSLKSKYDKGE